MTLSQKISVTILLAAIITVGFVGAFVFTRTRSALQNAIGENQLEVTRQTMDKIDRLLYERYLDISAIAENKSLELFLTDVEERGGVVSREDLRQEFRKNTVLTGPWDILFAVDENDKVVVSTDEEEIGMSLGRDPQRKTAFEQALQGQIYYSNFVLSGDTGKPTIIFAAPVRSEESGRPIIGVVIGNFTWPVVLEILEELAVDARLYNHEGLLIGASSPDVNNEDLLKDDTSNSILQKAFEKSEGSDVFGSSLRGEFSVLASYVRQLGYLNYKGSGWSLIVETPTALAFAPARQEAGELALVTAIISALAALGIFFVINRSVLYPIRSLTRTASIIAQGNLKKRARVSSKDEIGKLAESFNRMTDSLLDARRLPENIIHSLRDGLITFDTEGRVGVVNPQAERIFRIKEKDILGKSMGELKGVPSLQAFIELLQQDPGNVFRKELAIEGEKIFEVTIIRLGLTGREKDIMIVLHDITREKRIEQLKTDFVSIAAHQLRTPLSAVKWGLKMVLDGDVGQVTVPQKDLMEKTYKSNERMIALVNDLLSVARIEQGRYIGKRIQADIQDVLESVLAQLKQNAVTKGINFKVLKPAIRLPNILLDDDAMQVAVQNLIQNAIDYTPSGGTVIISSSYASGKVMVSVQDNGIGIASGEQDRIFTKFYRGGKAIQTKTEGSGLGLFIVKNIVEAHGGTIWFESEEHKGSTFSFTIPTETRIGEKRSPKEATK